MNGGANYESMGILSSIPTGIWLVILLALIVFAIYYCRKWLKKEEE